MAKKTKRTKSVRSKKTLKKSSGRSPSVATKKKKVATKTKKRTNAKRMPSRFNKVQRILSEYANQNGLKLGRTFNTIASRIYIKTKESQLTYVASNIDVIYKSVTDEENPSKKFEESFAFYYFRQNLQLPFYLGKTIAYEFDDGYQQFQFEGDSLEVGLEFVQSGLYKYLRKNYNGSPPNDATFFLKETDGQTYAKYEIRTSDEPMGGGVMPELPPKGEVSAPIPPQGASPFTAEQIIAIEKEKQKTLKQVSKLMKQGWTKGEIMKLLGM